MIRIYRIKNLALLILVATFLSLALCSCNNGELGWPVDDSHNYLFRPLSFTTYETTTSTIGVSYNKVVGATKYIFELSEDSLQFANVKERRVILADTLTAYSTSTSAPKIEYRTLFEDLNADTRYSVRMLAVNADSTVKTRTVQLTLKTPAENIFASISATGDGASFKWRKTNRLSYILLTKDADPLKSNILVDSVITAKELADTTKTITGLTVGTYYTAKLCYVDGNVVRIRGTKSFKTPGTAGSYSYAIQPAEIVTDVLTQLMSAGHTNISLLLASGTIYNWGTITLPAGLAKLTITGPTSNAPTLNLTKIIPSSSMDGFLFENVALIGAGSSSTGNQLFDLNTNNLTISDFDFEGCSISAYNCLIRFRGSATMSANSIVFNNCIVKDIGNYSLANFASATVNKLKTAQFTNCTFISLTSQLADFRTKLDLIEVSNCTFYNNSTANKMSQLFRFTDNANLPTTLLIERCLFAGNNGGTPLQSFYGNYTNLAQFTFSTSYRTNDLNTSTSTGKAFTGLNIISLSSLDLFTDPSNDIFTLKTGVSFPGQGVVGDPRWW